MSYLFHRCALLEPHKALISKNGARHDMLAAASAIETVASGDILVGNEEFKTAGMGALASKTLLIQITDKSD